MLTRQFRETQRQSQVLGHIKMGVKGDFMNADHVNEYIGENKVPVSTTDVPKYIFSEEHPVPLYNTNDLKNIMEPSDFRKMECDVITFMFGSPN